MSARFSWWIPIEGWKAVPPRRVSKTEFGSIFDRPDFVPLQGYPEPVTPSPNEAGVLVATTNRPDGSSWIVPLARVLVGEEAPSNVEVVQDTQEAEVTAGTEIDRLLRQVYGEKA